MPRVRVLGVIGAEVNGRPVDLGGPLQRSVLAMLVASRRGVVPVDRIIDHAKSWHGDREVVTRSVEGPVVRTTYAQIHARAKRVSDVLKGLGIVKGDRVATLAWNTARHIEAWYGIMGIGAVCHTLNPRLFADQLCYIINHAEDQIIFTDLTFVPMLAENLSKMPSVMFRNVAAP